MRIRWRERDTASMIIHLKTAQRKRAYVFFFFSEVHGRDEDLEKKIEEEEKRDREQRKV